MATKTKTPAVSTPKKPTQGGTSTYGGLDAVGVTSNLPLKGGSTVPSTNLSSDKFTTQGGTSTYGGLDAVGVTPTVTGGATTNQPTPNSDTPTTSGAGTGSGSGSGTPTTNPNGVIGSTVAATSASAVFLNFLNSIGLGSVSSIVQGWSDKGYSDAAMLNLLRTSPETKVAYQARFPAISALQAHDPSIDEGTYIAKENADRALLYQYLGPSAAAYDTTDKLGTLMTKFVSTVEFQNRLQAIHDEANASADTKSWMKSTYGLSDQDVAAAWLDPKLAADQVALRDQAAGIGGAGVTSGFGNLTQAQAELLASQGVTQSQAQNEFAKLGNTQQFQQALPGNDSGSMTQDQILAAGFNGGAPAAALQQLQNARLAQFQEGGGLAADSSGVVGLKSANTL